MKIGTFEIDVAHDYPLSDILKSFEGHSLTLVEYIKNGPGGGNQCLRIEGRIPDWDHWCMENYSEDPATFMTSVREE